MRNLNSINNKSGKVGFGTILDEKLKAKKRQIVSKNDRFQVFHALSHYWYAKKLISDKVMDRCLSLLSCDKNPFLNKEILEQLQKEADKKNYVLSHSAFSIKFEGDIQ